MGAWMKSRGTRDRMVILAKGAHTPHCNPKALTQQLLETLERMQTDYVDIYMMHRDNPEIPAGEFIDVLNEHVQAGRIGVFGGSNWSIPRIEEANAYAHSRKLHSFAAISNNFSLGRMVGAPWDGCLASSDPESRAWFTNAKLPLMPWSSQAQGFFTGRFRADDKSNANMVRCWYSDDNFKRLERAAEMAKKRNVDTTNIALAYVLNQPFPTLPLIGPRTPEETASCMKALDIRLTPDEMAWLNLEKD
jgi:aryl-alcohol dehydrogenase-like predicted oxidoreductase